ncbi:cyclic-phosphate processing receiver domain-containing protein [Paenibacillus sp. N3.4]|uniref:cyclic-phosphate processing receiver domain-containing protein n=1 Tax=Paenibacillus sp. N3.4 TaxID=2603222 RepID=UPI0011C7FFEE|nr:cyclic-phosphate processing receiver domain-containing protein [Paenibacillus sp. N3.4]TXK85398.1 cell division protein FtsJ [Paenibacillus sp. N3.4]
MIHVYLDDLRPCPRGFTLAKNVTECIMLLQEFEIDTLSLDHDLGWNSKQTGMDVVIWLVQQQKFPKAIYIHTSSPSACTAMYEMLYAVKPDELRLYPHPIPDDILVQIAQGQ